MTDVTPVDVGRPSIDPTSDRPVYKQIADWIRGQIDSGRLDAGDKLPSESELMRRFGKTPPTIHRAINRGDRMYEEVVTFYRDSAATDPQPRFDA